MAKVLFLQDVWIEYYGVMQLSGTLKKHGHETDIIFADRQTTLEEVKKIKPDLIAYSLMSVQWTWAKSMSKYLKDNGVKIWDEWADKNGELGNVYGYQWRNWPAPDGKHIDQIKQVIDTLKNNPDSRRIIVSAWNVGEIEQMALPPCHAFFQFYVADGKLSCQLYQRSADIFLGVPFNIASYALLTMMVAQVCNLKLGEFIHTLGDAHIYTNHFEQTELQLSRDCKKLPKMKINPEIDNIFDFSITDFELVDYNFHPHIKGKVAI